MWLSRGAEGTELDGRPPRPESLGNGSLPIRIDHALELGKVVAPGRLGDMGRLHPGHRARVDLAVLAGR